MLLSAHQACGHSGLLFPRSSSSSSRRTLQGTTLSAKSTPRQRRGRSLTCSAARGGVPAQPEPHEILGVERGASRAEIRAAYYARVQQVHPDVTGRDTNADAARLNLAYSQLIGDTRSRSCDADEEQPNVFDAPEGEASCVFVNPFACNVSPLEWRELQDVVKEAEDPEAALQAAGLYFAYDSAVCWVTPGQLEALVGELEAMEQTLSYELTGFYVTDCLLRAKHANDRVTYVRTERGVAVDN